jgi:predicted GIY-YIG superfamily endonuclease
VKTKHGLPRHVIRKPLKGGGWAYYFNISSKARKAGCPIRNEALGNDYTAAIAHAENVLLPIFDSWQAKPPPISPDGISVAQDADPSTVQPLIGVYLLLLKGKVVYVGSSLNMPNRVARHRTNGRPFDQVFYIATTANQREALETTLIRAISPPQNKHSLINGHGEQKADKAAAGSERRFRMATPT